MRRLILFVACLLPACGSPTEPSFSTSTSPLLVTADGSSLELLNFSDRLVFFFVYEREGAALINWAPCADAARCEFVAGRGRARVPYPKIGGYEPGKQEAIVWWWESLGGSMPGHVRALVVPL